MSPGNLLFLLILLVPAIEVYLFVQVGGLIGGWRTGLLVVITAVLGISLVRLQGVLTVRRLQEQTARGELPAVELLEGVMLLLAGALLITPGFFTDTLGFALLVPPLRRLLARAFVGRMLLAARTGRKQGAGRRVLEGEYSRRDDGPQR